MLHRIIICKYSVSNLITIYISGFSVNLLTSLGHGNVKILPLSSVLYWATVACS